MMKVCGEAARDDSYSHTEEGGFPSMLAFPCVIAAHRSSS